jgi:hypothetical protein
MNVEGWQDGEPLGEDLTTQRHRFEGDKAWNDVLILTMEFVAIISFS